MRCSVANIPTMDHKLILENSSSVAVYTLLNTTESPSNQTETYLLNRSGTDKAVRVPKIEDQMLHYSLRIWDNSVGN